MWSNVSPSVSVLFGFLGAFGVGGSHLVHAIRLPRRFAAADRHVTVRHDRVGELRASSSPCTPEEWESILKALLFGGEPIDGIEAGAEANVGKSITITIRRRVAGINVSLHESTLVIGEWG